MSRKGKYESRKEAARRELRRKRGGKPNGKILCPRPYGKTVGAGMDKAPAEDSAPEIFPRSADKDFRFCEVLAMWLDNNRVRYKGATETRYQYLIDVHILPALGHLTLSQFTAPAVNAFLNEKLEHGRLDGTGGLSPAYVRSIMLIVSAALRFASNEGMCQPLKSPIHKPALQKGTLSVMDKRMQAILEQYLLAELDCTKAGILISLYTGLRIGEICALSWDDIDLQNNILHVRHTVARVRDKASRHAASKLIIDTPKTPASCREIPISTYLIPVFRRLREVSVSQFVISDSASFLNPRTYEYRYHRHLKACGLEPVNYHALRHTFATRCIEANVDAKSLSEMLGHASISTTLNTYVHPSMELKRRQIEKLNAQPS